MRKLIIALAVVAASLSFGTGAPATAGCEIVEYQGAPIEVCPVPVPDPTNCYTGWYQGAPIEVCLPTGESLPEGSTFNGEPVVFHVSAEYVAPVAVAPPTVLVPHDPDRWWFVWMGFA